MTFKREETIEPPDNGSKKRCWEYLDCPDHVREQCAAYTNSNGKECWMVSEKRCGGGTGHRESIEEKLVECSHCEYYTRVLRKK
jgi:hypothetical protein